MTHGDRVKVTGLLLTPHEGVVRNTGDDFVLVDIELPSGETVAHMFFADDERLELL